MAHDAGRYAPKEPLLPPYLILRRAGESASNTRSKCFRCGLASDLSDRLANALNVDRQRSTVCTCLDVACGRLAILTTELSIPKGSISSRARSHRIGFVLLHQSSQCFPQHLTAARQT
jgi:hypothetical protein